jgi:nicotinamide riboside transporter PnuC
MRPHRGTLILVLGILGLLLCQVLGIFAWIMGGNDLHAMDTGQMDPSGRSITNAGRICGIVATVLLILSAVVAIIAFAVLGFSFSRST